MKDEFVVLQRQYASDWKACSPSLPEDARVPAAYVRRGWLKARPVTYCLPAAYAELNLLPEVRQAVRALFAKLEIPWHSGIDAGPSNHLLDSQVQCVNALGQMITDPTRLKLAFGGVVDVAEVLAVEAGRFLTFEYIGPHDYLNEGAGTPRVRGSKCTSVDAAFTYRTAAGATELALVEWKYTESYPRPRKPQPSKDATRSKRYAHRYFDASGPLDPIAPFELMLDEPFYQLMRQQLLAHAIENDPEEPFDAVRVLHVLDSRNSAYQSSVVRSQMNEFGGSVDEIWRALLRDQTKFIHVDPGVFRRPPVTSDEYVQRYPGPTPAESSA